jgi:hypothetical protein
MVGGEGVAANTQITGGSGSTWTVSPSQTVAGGTVLYCGAATFNQPTSIIMDSSGTMYVADQQNNAIRKITSPSLGVPGTVSTLCGGTVAPGTVTLSQVSGSTSYPVGTGSIVWNAVTNTGAVTMQNPTGIGLGYTLQLSGAINNSGGRGDPNSEGGPSSNLPRYIVVNWTNSQNFTIAFEPTEGNPNLAGVTIGTGPLGGSMTLTSFDADIYSSPTSVGFSSAYTPFPEVLRFTSTGNIVLGEIATFAARLINLSNNTISRITSFNAHFHPSGIAWMWLDCDYAGTCGPVDDIIITAFQDDLTAAHTIWRSSLAQAYSPSIGVAASGIVFSGDGFSIPNYAPSSQIMGGPAGHYPWAISMSRTEGRMIGTGTAQMFPVVSRIAQSGDPGVDAESNVNFNSNTFNNGMLVNMSGTASGFPLELRPAFWALYGQMGSPWIGDRPGHNTFEDLNATYPSSTPGDAGDLALGAYIQSGMGGNVPRPEMTGNDLRDFIYFIRRGTVGGSLGPTPTPPGANNPDNAMPLILTCTAVRNTATQITVHWTTDKPTVGIACAGTPNQFSLFGLYPMYSTISAPGGTYGTTHSMPVQVLSGLSPVHFTVLVKDMAGNLSHAIDHTIT